MATNLMTAENHHASQAVLDEHAALSSVFRKEDERVSQVG